MKFYQIHTFDDLATGTFGILEPVTNECISNNEGLMIMPGVVFDINCHRIGYGKGYYDRFIKKLPDNVCKVVLIPSELLIDNIYPDFLDEKCDYIVSEKNMLKIG